MKTYLITIREINGEYGYDSFNLIKCESNKLLINLQGVLISYVGTEYDRSKLLENITYFSENKELQEAFIKIECSDLRIVELLSFKEIPEEDSLVLNKYIYDITPIEDSLIEAKLFFNYTCDY